MNVKMVFPKDDGFVMTLVQTDQGRKLVVKTLTAKSQDEVDRLKALGWQVQQ